MQARRVTSHRFFFHHDRDFLSCSPSLTYPCCLCLPNWSCWIINGHPYFCTHRWHFDSYSAPIEQSSVAHRIGIWDLQMCSLRFIKNKCCVQHSGSENEPGHTIKGKHLHKLCDIYRDGIGTVSGELVYLAQSYMKDSLLGLIIVYCKVPRCLF